MIKCEIGTFEVNGTGGQIMAEFEIILRETRKYFMEKYGEEKGKKKFNEIIKLSELPESERANMALDNIIKTFTDIIFGSGDRGDK